MGICLVIHLQLFYLSVYDSQTELISGDQNGNIRVWDLTANSCSCELVCTTAEICYVYWFTFIYVIAVLDLFSTKFRMMNAFSRELTVMFYIIRGDLYIVYYPTE